MDNKKTRVDQYLNRLKNNKLIAIIVVVFIIVGALLKFGNEFIKFRKNLNVKSSMTNNENVLISDSLQETKKVNMKTINSLAKEKKENQSLTSSGEETSIISGRLVNKFGNGIGGGIIRTNGGEEVLTDENGYFKLELKKRKQQVKLYLHFEKEGIGKKGRYVGIDQKNIVLKL